ncbi:hypothetical protein SAMN02910451_01194 [Butyrivibrio hungatei]|uniref:Uncharacterized protein n=1 Tax=Butyrivibrio hungatei TaxID=185008 RepID=A0A1G5CSB3_9FIRM|nr:hypothetical protein SAMN02910451_01194 [Butyrivibrio hungatei]
MPKFSIEFQNLLEVKNTFPYQINLNCVLDIKNILHIIKASDSKNK